MGRVTCSMLQLLTSLRAPSCSWTMADFMTARVMLHSRTYDRMCNVLFAPSCHSDRCTATADAALVTWRPHGDELRHPPSVVSLFFLRRRAGTGPPWRRQRAGGAHGGPLHSPCQRGTCLGGSAHVARCSWQQSDGIAAALSSGRCYISDNSQPRLTPQPLTHVLVARRQEHIAVYERCSLEVVLHEVSPSHTIFGCQVVGTNGPPGAIGVELWCSSGLLKGF